MNNPKTTLFRSFAATLLLATGSGSHPAAAALYSFSGSPNAAIADNDPSGQSYAFNFAATGLQITDVSVSFTISGGWNGDLYAYLSHGSDTLVLLNRVGVGNGSGTVYNFGYSGGGFNNITLSDSGAGNIHNYGGTTLNSQPTANGVYRADGQTTSPLAPAGSFSPGGGATTFNGQFYNDDPNGQWTLFFADVSGLNTATLQGWTVDISAVPEPTTTAAGIFAGIFASAYGVRRLKQKLITPPSC
jgi:subtilisin-like proprotein convertase family protein